MIQVVTDKKNVPILPPDRAILLTSHHSLGDAGNTVKKLRIITDVPSYRILQL
jgi:hypothetical protein